MTVNAMPAGTWNRLRVNQAEIDKIPSSGACLLKTSIPEGVSCSEIESFDPRLSGFSEISAGMGPEFDDQLQENHQAVTWIRTCKGQTPEEPLRICGSFSRTQAASFRAALDLADDSALTLILTAQAAEEERGDSPAAGTAAEEKTIRPEETKVDIAAGRITDVSDDGCTDAPAEGCADMPAEGFAGMQVKIHAGRRARLRLYQLELLGRTYTSMYDLGILCEEDAQIEIVQLFLGQGKVYAGCRTQLFGDRSQVDISIGYQTARESILDMNYVAVHEGRKTRSSLFTSGVLRENAKKIFRGTIDFKKGAREAAGDEKEEVLLLDDEVINRTVPIILCSEEDVAGNHGATIGRIDEETLFYLESRGIAQADVYEMLARAKVDAVLVKLEDEPVRTQACQYLEGGSTI